MRILLLLAGMVAALVVGMGAGATLVDRSDTDVAESRALAGAALAVVEDRPDAGLLLAVEALRLVDGRRAADTYEARNALVTGWQRSRRIRAILRTRGGQIHAVAFSPDGKTLASAGETGVIRLWNVGERRELGRLEGHHGAVKTIAWSPDGSTLASGGEDKTIRLWDVRSLAPRAVLRGHSGAVTLLQFSPDGRQLTSGQQYAQVRVWDVGHRRQLGATLTISPVALHIDAESRQLVVASTIGDITRHDAISPRPYEEPAWDTGWTEYSGGAFTKSGKWLVLSGEDPLAVWRVTRRGRRRIDFGEYVVAPSALAAGAARIALGYRDGRVTVSGPDPRSPWDRVEARFNRASPLALDIAPDDETVAVGLVDGTVWVGSFGSSSLLGTRVLAPRVVPLRLTFRSTDGRYIARIRVPDDIHRRSIVTVRDRNGRLVGRKLSTRGTLLAFSPDGRRIAVVGRGGQIRYWDVEAGKPTSNPRPTGFPRANDALLAFNSDGTILAAASEEGLQLWDAERWAPLGRRMKIGSAFWARLDYDRTRNSLVALTGAGWGCCPGEYNELTKDVLDPLLVSSNYDRWRRRVCALVARNLTRNEWRVHIPSRPYRRTCP